MAVDTVVSIISDRNLNRTAIGTRIDLQVEKSFKRMASEKKIILQKLGDQVGGYCK